MFRSLAELFIAHRHSREAWNPKDALLGRDRRIFHRVPLESACHLANQLFGMESGGTAVNLSLGGAGVTAPVSWPEGSQVLLRLEGLSLDGLIVFRMDGKGESRYGIRFQRLGLTNLMKLQRVLRQKYDGPLVVL